jgi:ABC-type antimicrobial peptide transport system permease subunit
MLQHSLLIIYRTFIRYKSSFFINLTGLSTGLACSLLIYLWVNDELSMDKFHQKDSWLFQAMLNHQNAGNIETSVATPAPLAEALATEMPGVEYTVSTVWAPQIALSVGDKHIKGDMQFVSKDFFNLFSYKLLQGDNAEVLSDKNSIVLSRELAMKLFNTTDNIIGKPVVFYHQLPLLVTGIFEGTPTNSSEQFDFLLSFEVYKDLAGIKAPEWGSTGPRTFVLLKESTDVGQFNKQILGFIKAKNKYSNADLFLRPFSAKYLYDKYENGVQTGGRIVYVRLFSIIAIFILLIACINFMNLSTAKASRRLKEVGIKKAIGGSRQALVFQFLGESLSMAVASLIMALLLAVLLLPQFNQVTGKALGLNLDLQLILSALGITLFTGLVAGSYPAFYLSGFKPVAVLKGKLNSSVGEIWARKGLVVLQFTLSVIFIVAVTVVYKQIEYVQSKNLGYDKDQIIYFDREGNVKEKTETFLSEIKNIPGIVQASSSSHRLLGHQSQTSDLAWEGKNPEEIIPFQIAWINHDLIETLGIKMATGRPFSRAFVTDSAAIILNEAAIVAMGLTDPVGKVVNMWGKNRQIVGVTNNFHFKSLHEKVEPMLFILQPEETGHMFVKIEAGKESEVIGKLSKVYEAYNPGFVLNYNFLDADYQALYAAEQRVSVLSRYFAGLAILISCLGLFGLATFTAERRRKEIGIRKVLGSTEMGIVYLLTGEFTKMVLVAVVIALPISYLLTKQWLDNFAFSIDLQWWYFVGAGLAALLIAWLTVGLQAVKAARINPIQSLRDE